MDNLRQIFQSLDQVIVFGAGTRDAEGIGLLEGVAANQLGRNLAGDRDYWDGIHHGVHQPGGQVGGAGTGGGAADPHFPRGASVTLRGECRILFVPHQHVMDGVVVEDIVKRNGDSAGIAEQAIHSLANQTFHQHSCAAHQR